MIIINKKRFMFIEFCILIAILFNAILISNPIQTSSTPITGHIITLDAGHGTPDERCRKLKWSF